MDKYLQAFQSWYNELKFIKANNGPAKGTIAATLVVLDRLTQDYNLDFDTHVANGGAQIKGASGKKVAAILASFGEYRPYVREGGRTNRGLQGEIRPLFDVLNSLNLGALVDKERNEILRSFQKFLVRKVADFHNRQKIKFVFNRSTTVWQNIQGLMDLATENGKAGFVAQHLIGAKLELRFPDVDISNESASTAHMPTNRAGDFQVGDTTFHVTVAPMPGVMEKCVENLKDGKIPYLLVPESKLLGARQLADSYASGKISVNSIESFVTQNLEELGRFSIEQVSRELKKLILIYNRRVNEAETDKSLMIELPTNLQSY